jgi:3-oxoadipate enol-lactonase
MAVFADGLVAAEVSGPGSGASPTVWVLHSLLADAGSCGPLAAALAGRFRVVVPDLPGFGGSAGAAGLEAVAARVAAAIAEDAAAHGPVVLIGNGYGSFVALLVALRRPGVVGRLVLAGTGAAFSEPGRAAFRGMAAAAEAKGLAAIADVAMRRLFAPEFQAAHPALMAERRGLRGPGGAGSARRGGGVAAADACGGG